MLGKTEKECTQRLLMQNRLRFYQKGEIKINTLALKYILTQENLWIMTLQIYDQERGLAFGQAVCYVPLSLLFMGSFS